MSGIDPNEMRAIAEELISENGGTCTFIRYSRDPADPSKTWRGPADPGTTKPKVTVTAIGVVIPYDWTDDKQANKRGDAVCYAAAETFGFGAPFVEAAAEGFDVMTDPLGTTWRVMRVEVIALATSRIVYEITLGH